MRLVQRLLPFDALYDTCRRFPLPVVCAVILYALIVFDDLRFSRIFNESFVVMLTTAFFWLGGVRLMAEQMKWSILRQASVACAGLACLYLSFFVVGYYEKNYFIVICALLLFLMFAPYISGGDDTSFWFYNRTLWFGVIVSYLALILFAGSVSLAFYAIDELFNIHISGRLYGYVWSFAAVVLGPVYALSWVPKTFQFTKEDCADPPGLKFLIDWIVVPVGFFYLAILYVYFGKILITQDVPKNQLVWLITGFISSGIVTYLIAWPMRDEGSFQVRTFFKIFFPAMLIPIGFLAYAIWVRIDDYGLTEQRYLVVMAVLWFALLAISNSFARAPIKVLPMTLVPLLLFVSVGPWSYYTLPTQSQYNRLVMLLEDNGLLVDGEIVKAESPTDVPLSAKRDITGALDYLRRNHRKDVLVDLFTKDGRNAYKELGFERINRGSFNRVENGEFEEKFFTSIKKRSSYVDVSGYDGFFSSARAQFYQNQPDRLSEHKDWVLNNSISFQFHLDQNNILSIYENRILLDQVDMNDLAKTGYETRRLEKPFVYISGKHRFSYKIIVRGFNGVVSQGRVVLRHVTFDFLFSHPDLKDIAAEDVDE